MDTRKSLIDKLGPMVEEYDKTQYKFEKDVCQKHRDIVNAIQDLWEANVNRNFVNIAHKTTDESINLDDNTKVDLEYNDTLSHMMFHFTLINKEGKRHTHCISSNGTDRHYYHNESDNFSSSFCDSKQMKILRDEYQFYDYLKNNIDDFKEGILQEFDKQYNEIYEELTIYKGYIDELENMKIDN